LVAEQAPALERLLNGLFQVIQGLVPHFIEPHVLRLEATLQEKVRERAQQVLRAQPEVLTGESRVLDELHAKKNRITKTQRHEDLIYVFLVPLCLGVEILLPLSYIAASETLVAENRRGLSSLASSLPPCSPALHSG